MINFFQALFFGLSTSFAYFLPPPTDLLNGMILTTQDVELISKSGIADFFDTRSAVSYHKGRIPDAINISYAEKSERVIDFDFSQDKVDLTKLPDDKDQLLIFYSENKMEWKSYKAAVVAIGLGYTNVRWYREGFSAWVGSGLPIEYVSFGINPGRSRAYKVSESEILLAKKKIEPPKKK